MSYLNGFPFSTEPSTGSANQVDLFGGDLIGDLMDSGPTETSSTNNNGKFQEADLFADATFVSATAQGTEFVSQTQVGDFFLPSWYTAFNNNSCDAFSRCLTKCLVFAAEVKLTVHVRLNCRLICFRMSISTERS